MRDPRHKCRALRSPRGGRITEIDWGDGHKSTYPHEILRGYCPCAACQGHTGGITFIENKDSQRELETIEPTGNYGLKFGWFDGHDSGIYSYVHLRRLCQCDECRPDDTKKERPELARL